MSLSTTLATVSSLTVNPTSAQNQINSNFSLINTALANGVALNAQAPNQMTAALDMNSNQIINLSAPTSNQSPLRLADFTTLSGGGNIVFSLSNSQTGIGYATGVGTGGAVTQLTSRTTAVTLNKPTGAITLFSAAGSATATTFTVNNSVVAANDTVNLHQATGTNLYNVIVTAITNGSFNITFYTTGGTATDAPVINFAVIKGSVN